MAYNYAYRDIPSATGDRWEGGGSVLVCGDSTESFAGLEVDVVFTDFPWTKGILNQFHRYAGLAPIADIEESLFALCRHVTGRKAKEVWIEMGLQHGPFVKRAVEMMGYPCVGEQVCRYAGGQYVKYAFARDGQPRPFEEIVTMKQDQDLVRAIMAKYETLHDPCAGEGYFLLPALEMGKTVFGGELIPAKFSSMLKKLSAVQSFEKV